MTDSTRHKARQVTEYRCSLPFSRVTRRNVNRGRQFREPRQVYLVVLTAYEIPPRIIWPECVARLVSHSVDNQIDMSPASSLWRSDPRLFRIPPYVSFLCVVIGITWLLILPWNQNSRYTYVSENALLPGQVHTYFAGSDQNIFRAFKNEVDALHDKDNTE